MSENINPIDSNTVEPPPAAVVVLNGSRTEREIALESELEKERHARRKAETEAAYTQDELAKLRAAQLLPPASQEKRKSSGWTWLHD